MLQHDGFRAKHGLASLSVSAHGADIRTLIIYQEPDKMVNDSRRSPRIPEVGEAKRGPEGYLTYLLRQAHGAVRLAADRALSVEGMTQAQHSALTMIRAYDGLSAADLARITMLTPQTINGIVRALEVRGAIRKQPDPIHGRILRLQVTEEGLALNTRCRLLVRPIEAQLNDQIDPELQSALRHWLVSVARIFEA
jgi:DNA-binding MarR family transcriptional regulator